MRRARWTVSLSSSPSSSMPRIAMMSWRSLYFCRIPLTRDGAVVVVLRDVARVQDAGRGVQRVHGRVDALLGDRTGEHRRRVEVGEGGGRRRVGQVVRGDVDRLHRGDRVTAGRGDALLQETHLVGQVRLVTHRGGHTAEQGRDLGTGLGEPEDVVDEEQHVLLLRRHGSTPPSSDRPGRRADGCPAARPSGRRPARSCRETPESAISVDEVVALTGALADTGEHRHTVVSSRRRGRSSPG